jgi:hypothetical protein
MFRDCSVTVHRLFTKYKTWWMKLPPRAAEKCGSFIAFANPDWGSFQNDNNTIPILNYK